MATDHNSVKRACLSRRHFLLASGTAVTAIALAPSLAFPAGAALQVAGYPRKRVGSLSALQPDTPVEIKYPFDDVGSTAFLVKLGEQAGGGIGPDGDVVAFSAFCTHMGGLLTGVYSKTHKVSGPCPMHLTTFDLTRHGIVIAGHATMGLPQVQLGLDGDEIYATGVTGLIFGKSANV